MTREEFDAATGQKIRKWRKSAKLTQAQLAEKIGSAQTTIAGYENGRRSVPLETAQKIAAALDVPITEIMDLGEYEKVNRAPLSVSFNRSALDAVTNTVSRYSRRLIETASDILTDGEIGEVLNMTDREIRTLCNFLEARGYTLVIDVNEEAIENFNDDDVSSLGFDYIKSFHGYTFTGSAGGESAFGYHIKLTLLHDGKRVAISKEDLQRLNDRLNHEIEFHFFCFEREAETSDNPSQIGGDAT